MHSPNLQEIGINLVAILILTLILSPLGRASDFCGELFRPQKENILFGNTASINTDNSKFDDTSPPHEGGTRRRYSIKMSNLPLSIFFLGITSNSHFPSELKEIKDKLKKLGHPLGSSNSTNLDYLLDELLRDASATARYNAIGIISARQDGDKFLGYPFKDPELRLRIYKKIWDNRMDPNLGVTDSVDFTLAGIAIENRDPVLLKFILWNDKFDLSKSGLLEYTIYHDAYESATIILDLTMEEVTGEEIANVLTQATLGTFRGKTSKWLPAIFSDKIWIRAISKIASENPKHKYAIKQSGFSIPILQAAISQDSTTVEAILNSKFDFLKTIEDEYNPRFILNLVDIMSRHNGRLVDTTIYNLFLNLVRHKLKNTRLQIDVDFTGHSGPGLFVDGKFVSVRDKSLEQIIGPISVREVLIFFCYKGNIIDHLN